MIRGATFSSPDATISANTLQNTPHCDHSAFRPASSVGRWDLSGGDNNTTPAGPPRPPPTWVRGRQGGPNTTPKTGRGGRPPAGRSAPPPPSPPTPPRPGP